MLFFVFLNGKIWHNRSFFSYTKQFFSRFTFFKMFKLNDKIFAPLVFSIVLVVLIEHSLEANIIINGAQNISYSQSSKTCNVLLQTNVSASLRCLMLCQSVQCKQVNFISYNSTCMLFESNPQLVKYDSLPSLSIVYNLS